MRITWALGAERQALARQVDHGKESSATLRSRMRVVSHPNPNEPTHSTTVLHDRRMHVYDTLGD